MLVSCLIYPSTLKKKAILSSETLVDFYRTTRRIIPEDRNVLGLYGLKVADPRDDNNYNRSAVTKVSNFQNLYRPIVIKNSEHYVCLPVCLSVHPSACFICQRIQLV
jgi:hypothetical protein